MKNLSHWLLFLLPFSACCQPNFTANTVVPPWSGDFGYGANMGYFPPYYYDKELAALAHGTPDGQAPGVGVTTIRPGLFEHFLDFWGYDVRVDAFQYYQQIGLRDVAVIIGFPSDAHRDNAFYCPGVRTEVFKNLYEPIWDNGENGTPVNDNNPYALYCWKAATTYGPYVKFWEVWNEPDVDTGNAWAPRGTPGNWWENAPEPCETKLKAPVYFYIRLLRISYEVIKSVDPNAYICVGGLGWPSYLDVICRYSDNPYDGTVDPDKYPHLGGAYFDVMSFHSYPHLDNSLREWDNSIGGFRNFRHSDAAVDGVFRLKDKFAAVLNDHGYNGLVFPEKLWICTEVNIPRRTFGDYIGSDLAQTNFMIKTLVTAQTKGLSQIHIYSLADEKPESEADNEFSYMGLFKNLNDKKFPEATPNNVAVGYKTTSDFLRDKTWDPVATTRLKLPGNVRGAAFRDQQNQLSFVLWAATTLDRDETAEATYVFPPEFNLQYLEQKYWHYSQTGTHIFVNARQLRLSGSPVFLTPASLIESTFPRQPQVAPNPLAGGYGVYSFWMFEDGNATVEIFDSLGRPLKTLIDNEFLLKGPQQMPLDWTAFSPGVYFIRLRSLGAELMVKIVR